MMLAEPIESWEALPEGKKYLVNQKLDGARYQIRLHDGEVELHGRHSKEDRGDRFPEIISSARELAKGVKQDILLDGEIIISKGLLDSFFIRDDFSKLAGREHLQDRFKINLSARLSPATFIVFDMIIGNDTKRPQIDRYKDLTALMSSKNPEHIKIALCEIADKQRIGELFGIAQKLGLEGLVIKDLKGRYEPNRRSSSWLKMKTWIEDDFKVVGYKSKNREISALLLDDGSSVNLADWNNKVYTHLILSQKVKERRIGDGLEFLFEKANLTAKVKYLQRGVGGHLRFPILRELLEGV